MSKHDDGGALQFFAGRRLNMIDILGLAAFQVMLGTTGQFGWALVLLPTFALSIYCERRLAARGERDGR